MEWSKQVISPAAAEQIVVCKFRSVGPNRIGIGSYVLWKWGKNSSERIVGKPHLGITSGLWRQPGEIAIASDSRQRRELFPATCLWLRVSGVPRTYYSLRVLFP